MARKAMKRASSKAAPGAVVKKCKSIASSISQASDVPAPVRSMVVSSLPQAFGTFKEERHPFQVKTTELVHDILNAELSKLAATADAAKKHHESLSAELAALSSANDGAAAAASAGAKALEDRRARVTENKQALKDARAALHNLEVETKTAAAAAAASASRKEKLETLSQDYLVKVKDGATPAGAAARHVTKEVAESVDAEFLTCVTRTFSKTPSSWGTFDRIVDERLQGMLQQAVAGLGGDIARLASEEATHVQQIEAARSSIAKAEETAQAGDAACIDAINAAKEAEQAAKTAGNAMKQKAAELQKAADAFANAEDSCKKFQDGPLAAYSQLEARSRPLPKEPEAPAGQATADEAMAAAPEQAAAPSIMSSPAVLLQRAANAVRSSPLLAQ